MVDGHITCAKWSDTAVTERAPSPANAGSRHVPIIRVLLISNDRLLPAALCWTLHRLRPQVQIYVERQLHQGLRHLGAGSWSSVLLDTKSLECEPFEALDMIAARFCGRIAMLSSDPDDRLASFDGSVDCLDRSADLEAIATSLLNFDCRPAQPAPRRGSVHIVRDTENALTPAQAKVLSLMERGQLNKQIAYELGIAESTVKAHVSAIFRKLKVQNRVQATLAAHRHFGSVRVEQARMVA